MAEIANDLFIGKDSQDIIIEQYAGVEEAKKDDELAVARIERAKKLLGAVNGFLTKSKSDCFAKTDMYGTWESPLVLFNTFSGQLMILLILLPNYNITYYQAYLTSTQEDNRKGLKSMLVDYYLNSTISVVHKILKCKFEGVYTYTYLCSNI